MRPTIDHTMLEIALALSRRSTCLKMACGCVLTDVHGRILATGYNGVARGQPHCNQRASELDALEEAELLDARGIEILPLHPYACGGASAPPGADLCEAIHAEQNALTWCRNPDDVRTCYLTTSPCMRCTKQLLNTGCTHIVFLEEYTREPQAAALWRSAGRTWQRSTWPARGQP